MTNRELTAAELDAIALATPCTCGVADAGLIGGHAVECAALVATERAMAAHDAEWERSHPAAFAPKVGA